MTTDPLLRKEQELELVLALDQVRDSYDDDEDPAAMFNAITQLLIQRFQASACGVMLLTENGSEIQFLGYTGTDDLTAIALSQQAMSNTDLQILTNTGWAHTIGAPIRLHGRLLGGLFIARENPPFSDHEHNLLRLAESQIDSAVIQARTIWKFMQRNRELQAIFEIDQLRDFTASEGDLISGFTSALLKHFHAELCMIFLSHADSGEMILRGVVDKNDLSVETLDRIRQAASAIDRVTPLPAPAGMAGLHLLAAPLMVAGSRLGGVVIGNDRPFKSDDRRLLSAMISQMDSALVYSRVHQQLRQRNRELEVIYRIDQIRDQEKDFDAMLQRVLSELCSSISGELGFIMLYDDQQQQLELKAATTDNLLTSGTAYELIEQYSRQALETGHLIHANADHELARSIIAAPLILNQKIIGVFGAVNRGTRGFTSEDRRLLTAITSQVDTAIFERLEQRRMRTLLSRSVDPKVLDRLLAQADAARLLAGERVVLSVLFADLRGSTAWAERTEPEELVSTLNLYLGKMTEVIFQYGGTLDKFVGDEVIGLFGAPLYLADHAHRAARAALEMQRVHTSLQQEMRSQGRELPPLGIGVGSGEVIAGEFGPPIRTDFTAVGQVVNLSARLCSAADAGQVLISQAAHDLLVPACEVIPRASLLLKGIPNPPPVYQLLNMKEQ